MRYAVQRAGTVGLLKVGVAPPPGVIDDLVRNGNSGRAHGRCDATNRIHPDDPGGPGFTQRPKVSPIVDLVGWNTVRVAMPGHKQDRVAIKITPYNRS